MDTEKTSEVVMTNGTHDQSPQSQTSPPLENGKEQDQKADTQLKPPTDGKDNKMCRGLPPQATFDFDKLRTLYVYDEYDNKIRFTDMFLKQKTIVIFVRVRIAVCASEVKYISKKANKSKASIIRLGLDLIFVWFVNYEESITCESKYCKVPYKRPPPLKHKFLRKVGGGCLLGILPSVQSIIQPLKVQVNTKRLEFKQKSYLFQF